MEQVQGQGNTQLPFILFEVEGRRYAVDSERAASIARLGQVDKVKGAKDYIRGTIDQHGEKLRVVDLRALFGGKRLADEQAEMANQLKECKKAHQHWVKELEKSAAKMTPFNLTANPAECVLSKWLGSFQTSNQEIVMLLQKLKKPHDAFHAAGDKMRQAIAQSDSAAAQALVEKVKEDYIVEINELLDQILELYKESSNEMVITLRNDSRAVGIIADKVLGVHPLIELAGREVLDIVHSSRFVAGVGRKENASDLIILLDEHGLLELADS